METTTIVLAEVIDRGIVLTFSLFEKSDSINYRVDSTEETTTIVFDIVDQFGSEKEISFNITDLVPRGKKYVIFDNYNKGVISIAFLECNRNYFKLTPKVRLIN